MGVVIAVVMFGWWQLFDAQWNWT